MKPDDCRTTERSTQNPPQPSGQKHDHGKRRYDLLPFKAADVVVDVLSYGARKYAPENWRSVEDAHSRYMAAALRHISAHQQGKELDEESGLPHLAHAACCLLFLIELEVGNGK
jgi:hypothetical protein